MTETTIVQIIPTMEHKALKEGTKSAMANAPKSRIIFIIAPTISMEESLEIKGATISSKPIASGNIVRVSFEKAVKIINQVRISIARGADEC